MIIKPMLRALAVTLLLLPAVSQAQELCANGIDDDLDGLVDLNDTTDCACSQVIDTVAVTSIIPNASFECYTALPTGISQLNNACDWVQATTPTTDYFVNLPGGYFPVPPIMPMPLPNGVACVGGFYAQGWQEYLGSCLMAPLVAGTTYTLSMYVAMAGCDGGVWTSVPLVLPPTEVVIYGSPTCVPLPLATTDCPAVAPYAWDILGTIAYNPVFAWNQVQITFTPTINYDMVMIGPPCGLVPPFDWSTVPGYAPFMFYDDLTLNESSLFAGTTTEMISTDSLDLVMGGTGGSLNMVASFCFNNIELIGHPDSTNFTSFQWYFEGVALPGETDSIFHLSAGGYGPGTYQFVSNYSGGSSCSYSEITVDPPIYAIPDFSATPLNGCEPLPVQFTNDTDPAVLASSTWDFGDGSPLSLVTDPLHTYMDSGTYTVTLTVTSIEGCISDTTFVDLIHVDEAPTALFSVDTLAGCGPLTVNFTNETDPGWFGFCSWNIGIGPPIASCADFSHTYTVAGTYPVTLTVTSPGGCPSPPAGPVNITVYPDPNVLFSSNVPDGCSALAVQFSNDTDPALTDSVLWDLGDGTITGDADPLHVYPDPGTYDVSLTVISPNGCTGSATIAPMITVYGHPVPDFTNDPDSGCYALDVQFTNLTDTASIGSCIWDFGDGGTGIGTNPLYTYNTPGVFDVTLTVTSPEGCDGDTTYTQMITVFDHPTADFTMHPQPTDVFQTSILFFDASSDDVVAWDWSFGYMGALGTSDEPNPGFTFPDQNPDTYPVELIVTNNHGCQDTITYNVVIDPYFSVFTPNSFTPDGDGINDYFFPLMKDHDPSQYKLSIYDRWGGKVFESTNYQNVWTGAYMNQGDEKLPTGVYVWKLYTASVIDGTRKEFLGHVTLLK